MKRCTSEPPCATKNILPSKIRVDEDKKIKGKNINEEKTVFKNNIGMTALS